MELEQRGSEPSRLDKRMPLRFKKEAVEIQKEDEQTNLRNFTFAHFHFLRTLMLAAGQPASSV